MRVSQAMRPLASLASELRVSGIGLPLIGVAGLIGGVLTSDDAARAIVPFVLVAVLLGAVQYALGFRWYRSAIAAAPAAPTGAEREPEAQTPTRVSRTLLVYVVLIAGAILTGRGLGAVIGGVVFGVGIVDLYTWRWLVQRQRAGAPIAYREISKSLFASGRRPLYVDG